MKNILSEFDVKDAVISLSAPLPKERLLMVLGGRAPRAEWLRDFAESIGAEVWAVDSGVDACRISGILPGVLIGDGDSASPEAWQWACGNGAVEKQFLRDKNLTDFQLALALWHEDPQARRKMPVVTGCFGGRLDHLISNLQSFSSAPSRGKTQPTRCLIDDHEGIFLLYSEDEAKFSFKGKPFVVSLLPFSNCCSGVSIEGVRWPLKDITLERGFPWAISNEVIGCETAEIFVRCGRGILGVYWHSNQGQ